MKETIVKYKNAIIALMMIVLNGVVALASTPWTVNPSDFRYDMSLYLEVSFVASEMDYSCYDVGVFCGDECRGVAEVLSLSNGKSCLYVRARSNQESGETMTFKYYDKKTEKVLVIDGVSFAFESNCRLGYPSDPYLVKIIRHYDVVLSAGVGGTIDHAGGRIAEGTEITLTAAPNEGYHFEKWSDESTENPRTIIVNEDLALSAEFGVNTYKLTYIVDGVEYKTYDVDYGTVLTAEAIPEKEGYSFSGWEGLPETMPAHDVTVSGTLSINSYNAVFKIGEEIIDTKSIVYGQPVVAPEAPAKEGHTFAGWQDVPETMPSHDIEILGSYDVNSYKLTYAVDGATYKEYTVDYGTALTAEAIPEKEGYSFSGWEGLPETMPAHDVTVSGMFLINYYNAVFKIGEEIIDTKSIVYGQPVAAPEAPAKEGHTFAGWQDVPETMPAHDIEIFGSYTVNQYKLTYIVDGVEYKTYDVDYGTVLTPETPVKEGHTFSGWEGLPETMPAHDVIVTGSFTVNYYILTLYLNNEVYSSEEVVFGSKLYIETPVVPEGMKFDGWSTKIPETMPAYDLDIYGTYSYISGVSSIIIDKDEEVTVYTVTGILICKAKKWAEVADRLEKGAYIINGLKVIIRN